MFVPHLLRVWMVICAVQGVTSYMPGKHSSILAFYVLSQGHIPLAYYLSSLDTSSYVGSSRALVGNGICVYGGQRTTLW